MAHPKTQAAKAKKSSLHPRTISRKKQAVKSSTTPSSHPTPKDFTVRVRMYRQGLGDCHLLSFPRQDRPPFHLLIDFGALSRDAKSMLKFAESIEQTVTASQGRLDLIVATHEHKDHLSGFNQAREVFDRMDVGGVWMGWTENPEDKEAKDLKESFSLASSRLRLALASPRLAAHRKTEGLLTAAQGILQFTDGDDTPYPGRKSIADALTYLRQKGEMARNLNYLEPGESFHELDGVEGVRVYVLGPPRERQLLLRSNVTKAMQHGDVIYHLGETLGADIVANSEALDEQTGDSHQPFSSEHRIKRDKLWWKGIKKFVTQTYDNKKESWRRIDKEWLGVFDQLALKLADSTNNTSLVLAFEIVKTREVLLFAADAQVGNWQSWATLEFGKESAKKVSAHGLLRRTVFYKVGHHGSHNATLKKGGLELMNHSKLIAFIPLDKETAAAQGPKSQSTGMRKGWKMPAKALYEALKTRTSGRCVISDKNEKLSPTAKAAGVTMTEDYVEYKL